MIRSASTIVLIAIFSSAMAIEAVIGNVKESHTLIPDGKSKPNEFTFSMSNGERYIMYTNKMIVFVANQEVKLNISPKQNHETHIVVCRIELNNLTIKTTYSSERIPLEKPIIHKAVTGNGC